MTETLRQKAERMRKNFTKYAALATCLGVLAFSAQATTIYELGTVDPGSPASPSDETGYLNTLLLSYNLGVPISPFTLGGHTYTLAPGSYVPAPILAGPGPNNGQVCPSGSGVTTGLVINLGAGGFNYAMVKWGNTDEFYYVAGLSGNITLNNDTGESPLNGESHYDLFGKAVPDGGATVVLLGVALSGLGLIRRKLA
jgi:hypothetical protein